MNTIHKIGLYVFCCVVCMWYTPVHAQATQMISVTPPLFQLNLQKSNAWQSSIKVVNGNKYQLTVYATVVGFAVHGEKGQGSFIPVNRNDDDQSTFPEWITLDEGPYTIEPEKNFDINFVVTVPENAPPGGHYAAILVSTEPANSADGALAVHTSQTVTSLLFMRVGGDVAEDATIREFTTTKSLLSTPDASFMLRFENKGNVHLLPRGDITITNMWGTERGKIPVNNNTQFGNVMPKSIRAYEFTWKSDFKITDIGRYKAIATLGYGENGVQSTDATTYFWVVPVKGTLITLGILAFFISVIVLMIRAYIRRVLALSGVDVDDRHEMSRERRVTSHDTPVRRVPLRAVSLPLREGVLDLRTQLSSSSERLDTAKTIFHFVGRYKWFFISVCTLILIFVICVLYIQHAREERTDYTIMQKEGESMRILQNDTP